MIEKNIVPIIDRKDIVRDTRSQAILTIDTVKLNEHREKKKLFTDIYKYMREVETLKVEIEELKRIVKELQDK